MTVYLPVWHSHCTSARFTVMVSCSDEIAVHSCPSFACRGKLRTDSSTVDLYCVSI